MRRAVLVAAAIASLASPALLAQGGGLGTQPVPAAQTAPPKSTALILGQVVDGSSGQPIPEAVVTLTQMGGGRGANPLAQLPAGASPQAQQAMQAALANAAAATGRGGPKRAMTGADGRFVFHDLPPGQFQLIANLTGYTSSLSANPGGGGSGLAALLASAMASAGGAPTSLAVKEGEFVTGVRMRLWKNAIVTGTVVDDAGEPAIGVSVQVARRVMATGRARYVPDASAKTDDRGVYRISGLVPGNYLVVVPQAQLSIPTAVLSGLIDSLTGNGAAGGGMAVLDLMTSGLDPTSLGNLGGGVRIGDYMVASSGAVPLLGRDGRLQAFQTIFYPGAAVPTQASVLALASGEERTDVNFQMRLIPTSRVSGVATGPDGPVANLGVRLVVPGDGTVSESEFDVATAVSKADGAFSFFGVPPGPFLLRAVKEPRPPIPAELLSNPTMAAMFGGGGAKGTTETLYASTSITVAGGDVDGVVLQLAPGFRVSGRLEFQSQAARPQPAAAQLQTVVIALAPMDGRSPAGLLGALTNPDRVNAESEFKTKGYGPGKYFLSTSGPAGWQLSAATIGGRDVLDAPIEIADADVAGVVLTFTDRMAQLTGTVTAAGETDVSEISVLLFPAGYRAWIQNGMNPRRARTARATRAGGYTIANLPAGEYLAVAIDRADEGDMQDPAFIERLSRLATPVTVGSDPATLALAKVRVGR